MRSKRATEPRELAAIARREIMPGLVASVSFSSLSPFVLGYVLYRMLVGRGAALVPQDAFFLVGLVTAFSLAWGISSCLVAFLKVRHLMVRPLERLASAAAYRTDRGSADSFRLRTRVKEQAYLIDVFNRLFGCQDERVVELVDLIHVFGHNASRCAGHVSGKANLCLDPVVPPERRKEHLAELPHVAIDEIGALDDHLCQCTGSLSIGCRSSGRMVGLSQERRLNSFGLVMRLIGGCDFSFSMRLNELKSVSRRNWRFMRGVGPMSLR